MSGWPRLAALWLVLALAAGARLAAAQEAAAAAAPAPPGIAPQPAEEAGPLVTAIEIRSDAPLPEEEDVSNLIEAEVGEPLTEDKVIFSSLRNINGCKSFFYPFLFLFSDI